MTEMPLFLRVMAQLVIRTLLTVYLCVIHKWLIHPWTSSSNSLNIIMCAVCVIVLVCVCVCVCTRLMSIFNHQLNVKMSDAHLFCLYKQLTVHAHTHSVNCAVPACGNLHSISKWSAAASSFLLTYNRHRHIHTETHTHIHTILYHTCSLFLPRNRHLNMSAATMSHFSGFKTCKLFLPIDLTSLYHQLQLHTIFLFLCLFVFLI